MVLSLLRTVDPKNRCFTSAGAPVTETACKLTRKLDLAFSNFSGCVLKLKYNQSDFWLGSRLRENSYFSFSLQLRFDNKNIKNETDIVTWSIRFRFPSLSKLPPASIKIDKRKKLQNSRDLSKEISVRLEIAYVSFLAWKKCC